jgi:galactose mutarotase-like enzyme
MRKIQITNGNGITGWVYPEYGGMLGRLTLNGRDIFSLDEERLSLSPLLAGGNPVLFPFPSRTVNDTYTLSGREYYMPFHGLVTNAAFLLEEVQPDGALLSIRNSPSWIDGAYPFDFLLKVSYRITENGVRMTAIVSNLSEREMPHCFGWHCYFKVSDKASVRLGVPMAQYIDYTDGKVKPNDKPDLCVPTDYVFFDRTGMHTVLENPADGYRAEIAAQDIFNVVTVCSRFDGKLCVEPWIGLPDSANTGRYLQYVPAHETRAYWTEIILSEQ